MELPGNNTLIYSDHTLSDTDMELFTFTLGTK